MGAIEDTRKVLQDFLAPELREIRARLDALEKQADGIDRKIDSVEARLESSAEKRHEAVMAAISRIVDYAEVRERLVRLESREVAHQ